MKLSTKKLTLAPLLIALGVIGSTVNIPVFASKCCPVQHMINVLAAVILGPWYALGMAFVTSVIRNLLGLGSLFAFGGSMMGAFLAGVLYKYFHKTIFAYIGEVVGTGILGGLVSYPVALFFMGNKEAVWFAYIGPFALSSLGGTIIAAVFITALKKTKVLDRFLASEQTVEKKERVA